MRILNEATYVESFMFLGSLMFLDFYSGDCSDCYLGFDNVVFWVGY